MLDDKLSSWGLMFPIQGLGFRGSSCENAHDIASARLGSSNFLMSLSETFECHCRFINVTVGSSNYSFNVTVGN